MLFIRFLRGLVLLSAILGSTSVWAGEVYKLYVDGLACPFCAYGVEKKVTGLKGVEKIDIDIDGGLVSVTMAGGATLDEATASEAVDQAGFSLRKFEAPR